MAVNRKTVEIQINPRPYPTIPLSPNIIITRRSKFVHPWLPEMTISDACFRLLFRMTVRITIEDVYFGWPFGMTIPDDWSAWIYRPEGAKWKQSLDYLLFKGRFQSRSFVIPWPFRILATNSYFYGRFLFQTIIGTTTDSFLNDVFLLQNYGPDPPWY